MMRIHDDDIYDVRSFTNEPYCILCTYTGLGIRSFALLLIRSSLFHSKSLTLKSNHERFTFVTLYKSLFTKEQL